MLQRIAEELEQFSDAIRVLRAMKVVVEEVAEHAFLLNPRTPFKASTQKDIVITVMGLTHGNEVGGLAAITDWLRSMSYQAAFPSVPIAVVLGNVKAAQLNQRFCDRDLNRSFNRKGTDTWEDRRAREIEKILERTSYLIDLHQTICPSVSPFFIFPYKPESFAWAQAINHRLPVVTHWGAPFSQDGCCTDEYVNSCGGIGLTIELGQNGFAPALVAAGTVAIEQAIATSTRMSRKEPLLCKAPKTEIYTWADSLAYPKEGEGLHPGYMNFQDVKNGERLGGSQTSPIVAPCDGKILFPKYPQPGSARPAELCRIIRRIEPEELGRG